ncbi:hypothetical protein GCM10023083_03560 [Streptomyces phyllanthi]
MLVKHLPRDSATLQNIHGDAVHWSVTDYLLASVVDQLAEANWMFATVNRDEDAEPLEYPKPVPRPVERGPETSSDPAVSSPAASAASAPPPEQPARNPTAAELAQFFS